MIHADSAVEIGKHHKVFLCKWRLKCRPLAPFGDAGIACRAVGSLEEAGDRLFTFTRLDPSQRKPARTTNAIERLNEEFRRRIKTRTVLPCAETAPMLVWALMASGQIHLLGRLLRNRLPGNGCGKWMVGEPWLGRSPRSALTLRPDQTQVPTLAGRRQRIPTRLRTAVQKSATVAAG